MNSASFAAARADGDSAPVNGTRATAAYALLRRHIIRGELLPGEKLRVDALAARFGLGPTPLREALNRLSMEKLVWQQDQRGFRVAPVSTEHLLELTRTRSWITEIALRESIAHGDGAWEDGIVMAYRRLMRTDNRLASAPRELNPEWEDLHRSFHDALTAACPSPMLLDYAARLFEEGDRYRNLSVRGGSSDARDVKTEHRQIMEAVLDRNTGEALRLMNEHNALTTRNLLQAIGAQQVSPTRPEPQNQRPLPQAFTEEIPT